jgi:hypothetical protein
VCATHATSSVIICDTPGTSDVEFCEWFQFDLTLVGSAGIVRAEHGIEQHFETILLVVITPGRAGILRDTLGR